MLLPNALHSRVADANLLSQHACTPVCGMGRLLFGRARDDLKPYLIANALLARIRALGLVLEQPLNPAFPVRFLPAPHRRLGHARLASDPVGTYSAPRQHNDHRPLDDLLPRLAISN